MQKIVNGITYTLETQEKQPAPLCCSGCAVNNDSTLKCSDFSECTNSDNLDKVWKRQTPQTN